MKKTIIAITIIAISILPILSMDNTDDLPIAQKTPELSLNEFNSHTEKKRLQRKIICEKWGEFGEAIKEQDKAYQRTQDAIALLNDFPLETPRNQELQTATVHITYNTDLSDAKKTLAPPPTPRSDVKTTINPTPYAHNTPQTTESLQSTSLSRQTKKEQSTEQSPTTPKTFTPTTKDKAHRSLLIATGIGFGIATLIALLYYLKKFSPHNIIAEYKKD